MYPHKVEINVVERKISYMCEAGGKYIYLDENGYILETSLSPLEYVLIKGCKTDLSNKEMRFKNR